MFHIAAENLQRARTHHDVTLPEQLPHHFIEGDTAMIKNHTTSAFDSKYIRDFRIVSFKGYQVKLIPSTGGRSKMEHISNIKYIIPTERYISQLPFGRQLQLNPRNIPDLSWKWADTVHTQDIGRVTVSHILHLDFLPCEDASGFANHDSLETILVNTNVYT